MNETQDMLVGAIAAVLVGMILARIVRGVREGRLPLYRSYFERAEGAAKFNVLLGLHILSLVVVALIAADLLLGLNLKEAL
jgi:predicted small integral membrane protein